MGYDISQFGDNVLEGSGGNVASKVSNHYGPRETGEVSGVVKTEGATNQLVLEFDGTNVSDGAFTLQTPKTLPAGANIEDVWLKVSEVFVLGGTTPVVDIGTEGSEATNGFTMSEANLESVQTVDLTSALSGTWAAPLAASTTIGILLGGGGSNTVTAAGKAKVIINYSFVGAV